ncbi:hypothetical protein IE53DRAFT_389663 [Violaceomyces palustris]|uniref:Uncharacterized protein n=1 Tax=Violaceomyces palustris TaxID=1673888 RepID=A0ACD0NQY3_9BASI|nr:hypothetical protein IE53DRAFT_389663 [Violaceomyces palustris]
MPTAALDSALFSQPSISQQDSELQRAIRSLSDSVSSLSAEGPRAFLKDSLATLQRLSSQYGLTAKQSIQVINLALTGSRTGKYRVGAKPRLPKPSTSIALLKCIIPRRGVKLGKEAILAVLVSLGPAPGSIASESAGVISIEVLDEDDRRGRIKVDVKVQAAALKMLLLLYDVPPLPLSLAPRLFPQAETDAPPHGTTEIPPTSLEMEASSATETLPSTFLSGAARRTLEKCYGVLFHFLEYQTLRPNLCHLLCKLSRRKHVKHYRISKLMSLRATASGEAGLSALLSVYANFYPDLLFPELISGSVSGIGSGLGSGAIAGLKYPDGEWLATTLKVHAGTGFLSHQPDEDQGRPAKKLKLSFKGFGKAGETDSALASLPTLATLHSPVLAPSSRAEAVKALASLPPLITELSSLRHLAHCLDRLSMPSQLAAMLGAGFGARLMRIAFLSGGASDDSLASLEQAGQKGPAQTPGQSSWIRLSHWLRSVLRDEIGCGHVREMSKKGPQPSAVPQKSKVMLLPPPGSSSAKRLILILSRARGVYNLMGELPLSFEKVLLGLINGVSEIVQGVDARAWTESWEAIFGEFLAFIPILKPQSWQDHMSSLFEPLQEIALSPNVSERSAASIVEALAKMLERWGSKGWESIIHRLDRETKCLWGVSVLDSRINYMETISMAAVFSSDLNASVLRGRRNSVQAEHSSLLLHEVLSSGLSGLHPVVLPPPAVFYSHAINSRTIMPISRLFGLVQLVRRAFETYDAEGRMVIPGQPPRPANTPALIRAARDAFFSEENRDALNASVVILADLVWRGKAFATAEGESTPRLGFKRDLTSNLAAQSDERGNQFNMAWSVTHGLAFSNLAEKYCNEVAMNPMPGIVLTAPDQLILSGKGRQTESDQRQQHEDELVTRQSLEWIKGPITSGVLRDMKRTHSGVQNMTFSEFRANLLSWLSERGVRGLHELLSSTMSSLSSKASVSASAAGAGGGDTTVGADTIIAST